MTVMAAYIVPHPPLIVPAVGAGQEKMIQDTVDAYHSVASEIGKIKPDTVIVITPHSIMYQDYLHISPGDGATGHLKRFGDNKTRISVDYDTELVSEIEMLAGKEGIAAGTLGEREKDLDHGAVIPLYFIEQYLEEFETVRVSVSGLTPLEHYRFGKCIKEASEKLNRKTVIVASGDLSHRLKEEGPYSYAEEGPIFDEKVTSAMESGDFLKFMQFDEGFLEAAGECGLRGFVVMAGALDGISVDSKLLSYEGPFGVGYAVASFYPKDTDETRNFDVQYQKGLKSEIDDVRDAEGELVRLARLSLETYVKERKYLKEPTELSEKITKHKAGVFVTLKKEGRLRGCIGTISPVEDGIASEIIRNAVSAGTGDPRFDPVSKEELKELI
ncbi:MAG TPA: AmmeMemoRadiSam system protein B, partial [Anaerovoracaceae bacterium]|nr:AmmeMemoRadiSam system protein B [Anaerovoracaceae bacterium]